MFLIFRISSYVRNRTPLSGTKSVLCHPPTLTYHLSISLCSLSLYNQSLPVRFPTTYCSATVAGYNICGRQGRKTCLKHTDWEMMMMMSGLSWKVMQFCPFLLNRPLIACVTYFFCLSYWAGTYCSSKITWVKTPGVLLSRFPLHLCTV